MASYRGAWCHTTTAVTSVARTSPRGRRSRTTSSDATASIARRHGATVDVLDGGTIGACRNRGVDLAAGEYVAFTDSDCAVPATWLRSLVDRIESRDGDHIVGVGGPNRAFPSDPPFAKLVGSLQGTVCGSVGSPQSDDIDRVR